MTTTRTLTVYTVFVIILHIWGAAFPSHYNWGFHYFAFFSWEWSLATLLLAGVFLLPSVRLDVLSGLSRFAAWSAKFPSTLIFLAMLGFWIMLMVFFPVKLHLLGDSEIILQLTPDLPSIEDVSANFRNQPLTYQSLRLIQWLAGGGSAVEPITLYRIADAIAGTAYLGLLFFFLRSISTSGPARLDILLLGIILLFRSGTQFFLGYVENYMFFYVALTAFMATGWLSMEKKIPVWIPLLILPLIPAFHIAGVIFVPAGLLLLKPGWKSDKKRLIWWSAAMVLAAAGGVMALDLSWVLTRIGDAFRYDTLPFFSPKGGLPYGIFSTAHLIDWANANLHIAPFGIACVTAGLIFIPRKEYLTSPLFLFLAGTTLIGVAMTLIVVPGLGMARDWDMLSNFFIPLRFLMVYFLILFLRHKEARNALLAMAVVSLIHWSAWIGINSDEDRHLARAEMLTVPELSGTFPKLYFENLGKTFIERKDYPRAIKWYEAFLKIDSTHPRILANLSDCYRAVGDKENVFRILRLSVDAHSTNAGVYSNLAVEYVSRGDTVRAISLLEEGVRLDPSHAASHANLCMLNMQQKNYARARQHAAEAIRLGMRDPILFKQAGYASYYLKDYNTAILSLNEYLKSAPTDESAKKLFTDLQTAMGKDSPLIKLKK